MKLLQTRFWIKFKNVFYKKIDSREYNTAKELNIITEFNEFNNVLFNRKILRHKMRRFQAKKQRNRNL